MKELVKNTISMCPVCYREIPARVFIDGNVVRMFKVCPNHGEHTAVVEVDVSFYLHCLNNPSDIYDGHLVDVTTRCNLGCKYCYFVKSGIDLPVEDIVNECTVNRGPYILTGGEPTLRNDLPEIIGRCSSVGHTYFLTNGTGLLDKHYLQDCNEHIFKYKGFSGIGLSYHQEFNEFDSVIENMKSCEIKPHTVFFVIDSLDHLEKVKAFAESNAGLVDVIRIKCASNIWNEGKAGKIYASEVLNWFKSHGDVKIPPGGKSVYYPFYHGRQVYSVISWNDVNNVDLMDIDCPPTYRAKNGEVADFVKSMLTNEGMSKGWLRGNKCSQQ